MLNNPWPRKKSQGQLINIERKGNRNIHVVWGVVKTVFVGKCIALNTNLKSINRKINLITREEEEIRIWVATKNLKI